jgi:hypothetical protein
MDSMPYMGDVAETEPCVLAPVLLEATSIIRDIVKSAEPNMYNSCHVLLRRDMFDGMKAALARAEAALKEAADE